MRFEPKTDEELAKEAAARGPLPAGVYDFEVLEADNAVSKSGNDMIAMVLTVYDDDGRTRKVKDWLLPSIPHKLKRAAYTCGLGKSYEAGMLDAEDFRGRPGKVKLKVERDVTGKYADKNAVQDYVMPDAASAHRAPPKGDDIGMEIPF